MSKDNLISAKEVAEAYGADAAAIAEAFHRLAEAINTSPQAELKFRLNCNIKGQPKGEPVNQGPDGWRV